VVRNRQATAEWLLVPSLGYIAFILYYTNEVFLRRWWAGREERVDSSELGFEMRRATPAEECVAVDLEFGGDGSGAAAEKEEAKGGELLRSERGRGRR
jgi:hypothetical protein